MDSVTLMDILLLGIGLYTIYSAVQMKKSGDLKKGWLVGNDVDMRKVKDAKGYIQFIFGKTVFLGAMASFYALVGILTTYIDFGIPIDLEMVMTFLFGISVFWFILKSVSARKIYLDGIEPGRNKKNKK